jgi:hypothetical protein
MVEIRERKRRRVERPTDDRWDKPKAGYFRGERVGGVNESKKKNKEKKE